MTLCLIIMYKCEYWSIGTVNITYNFNISKYSCGATENYWIVHKWMYKNFAIFNRNKGRYYTYEQRNFHTKNNITP